MRNLEFTKKYFIDSVAKKCNLIRISKKEAEKEFNKGSWLVICPHKYNINFMGEIEYLFNKNNHLYTINGTFEEFISNYEFYNCNKELGKYSAFYKVIVKE